MKFFTLYSAKYKKRVSNLRCGKMPLFTVLSFCTPKSAENLKIIATNSWKSTQCMFYVRPLYRHRTTEGLLQHTFRCFQTKTHHAARKMNALGKGHVVQNIRYLVGTSDITTISNNRGNILQISCKTSLKKTKYRCVVQMHGSEHTRCFRWFRSDAVIFQLFKVFSLSLQHIWRTYRANIHDQLIENTTIVSVDVILSV